MKPTAKQRVDSDDESIRVLGRGLRAQRGVHLTLRTIRDATGKTQVEVATESGIDQSDISRLEARDNLDDCQVSTLRRYVAALGGELQLVAVFGDKKIALVGTPKSAPTPKPAKKALQRTGRKAARR